MILALFPLQTTFCCYCYSGLLITKDAKPVSASLHVRNVRTPLAKGGSALRIEPHYSRRRITNSNRIGCKLEQSLDNVLTFLYEYNIDRTRFLPTSPVEPSHAPHIQS